MQLKKWNNNKNQKHKDLLDQKKEKYKNLKLNNVEEKFLFETYIKFIDTEENTTNRRILINTTFYLTLIVSLFSLTIFMETIEYWISLILSIIIFFICILWYKQIIYYKKLNTAKFEIMKIISEKLMKTSIFDDEYDIYQVLQKKYYKFTDIEKLFPILFLFLSLIIIISSSILM
ncbi:hypothetical protein HEPPS_02860 [Candidatus Hepatoplasma crinochetorum]|uniref:Uncharacterized protein n=1 Tax=Candidatus Hepatoplasma crinochetorum TaxID=295596 RepID=A0A0G7ZN74_9MOLU|nr:hypothetical protein HEPPS_02860 [Candidatus Hepatoplasma crinochetorum]